jgi:hypothetical protein
MMVHIELSRQERVIVTSGTVEAREGFHMGGRTIGSIWADKGILEQTTGA